MASLWVEDDTAAGRKSAVGKADSEEPGSATPPPAPPTTGSDLGPGIDPDG
jgi:hypothetical protein